MFVSVDAFLTQSASPATKQFLEDHRQQQHYYYYYQQQQQQRQQQNWRQQQRGTLKQSTPQMAKNNNDDDSITTSTTTPPPTGQLPKVIVFDLDNTLWTPELYQLKRLQGRDRQQKQQQQQQQAPVAGRDVKLFPGAEQILKEILPRYQIDASTTTANNNTITDNSNNNNGTNDYIPPFLAIASRTQSVDWAQSLVNQFGFRDTFTAIEIYPGCKTRHFANIQRITGVPYNEMIFFDDARDGKYGNCVPVSSLGVLCVHCPIGLVNADIFTRAMELYQTMWDKAPSTIVEWDGRMTTTTAATTNGPTSSSVTSVSVPSHRTHNSNDGSSSSSSGTSSSVNNRVVQTGIAPRLEGIIKLVRTEKRFGFIRYRGPVQSRDVFFHFRNVMRSNRRNGEKNDDGHDDDDDVITSNDDDDNCFPLLQEGDIVSFQIQRDPRNPNKDMAVNVKVVSSGKPASLPPDGTTTSWGVVPSTAVQFRCFSMNQPFAALLANGYKTLETRNGTMFTAYAEGTQMLLHVGKRTYPDGGKHVEIMKKHHHHSKHQGSNKSQRGNDDAPSMGDEEVRQLKSLPPGFSRGDIVAIVELGKTYETAMAERCDPDFERKAVAYGADSGRFVTEIVRATYLKRPIKRKGEGGVFKVRVDSSVIPDEYYVPTIVGASASASEDALNGLLSG